MKGIRILLAFCAAVVLSACGDSIKSPDFSKDLIGLALTPATLSAPDGTTVQLSLIGEYTQQPGESTELRPVTEANYTVTPGNVATVDASGLVTATEQGVATITASVGGVTSNTVTLTVGAPRLDGIVVRTRAADGTVGATGAATVPAGATQSFKALGIYSNSTEPQELGTDVTVAWTSTDTAVATVSPATGVFTNATALDQGATEIRAVATKAAQTFQASGSLTVSNALLTELLRVELNPATIAAGQSSQATAIGKFADNSEGAVANDQLDWSSADTGIATVAATGLATGVAQGNVAIKATLKDAVVISGTQREASATLSVGDAACTEPLLQTAGATVSSDSNALCLGCLVDDEANITDADLTNYANMISVVGLLGDLGNVSVKVHAGPGIVIDASVATPRTTGFVIGRPASQLLSAEVLSQIQVATLKDGVVQESSEDLVGLLRLTLLGLLGDNDTALASIQVTKPFDELQLTFNPGLLTALSTVRVFSACGTATVPPATP